jgi:hypothetical protein
MLRLDGAWFQFIRPKRMILERYVTLVTERTGYKILSGKSEKQRFIEYPGLTWGYLFGLVVRVPGHRSEGLGSIPGTTRFSEK